MTSDAELTSCGARAIPSHTGISPSGSQPLSLGPQEEGRNHVSWKLGDSSFLYGIQVTTAA